MFDLTTVKIFAAAKTTYMYETDNISAYHNASENELTRL